MTREQDNARFVGAFQRSQGLRDDEWAGPKTFAALAALVGPQKAPSTLGLETFRGDLEWVHRQEGHNGKPYWPGGASGITLDPGFDLGYQNEAELRRLYEDLLNEVQVTALIGVLGLTGTQAKGALSRFALDTIRISREDAARIFPELAARYWQDIVKRFPVLTEASTPPSVQTAALSLSYNRGAKNKELAPLAAPLEARDWRRVADLISEMQQTHRLAGIRRRRREEAELIRKETA